MRLFSPIAWDLALLVGDALISRSRSQACNKFLEETDIPYMLFIDEDIIFEPHDAQKIFDSLKKGYDVIGGIYAVRGASQLSSYGWGGNLVVDGQIHDIEYLATGFMGISRKILIKVRDELKLPLLNENDWSRSRPFFEALRFTERPVPIYISEDWDFCEKVRKVGGKIYADTSVQLGHIREQVFTPADVQQLQAQAYMRKKYYGAMDHQHELLMSVDTDLSEFLGIPITKVQERMQHAQEKLARMWTEYKGTTEEFYKDNEEYLFDLAAFNKQPGYFQDRLSGLVNLDSMKILDIGCGIGSAVFMLAEQGCDVLGWDINQKCIDFCNFKKKKYNLKGEFTTERPDFKPFDLVIAVDLLEHIENLEEFVLDLNMKSGAKLYHSDFFPREKTWPMHFEENGGKLSGWLQSAGFIEWDGKWAIKK